MRELSGLEQSLLWGVIVVAFISLAYAYWLWRDTMRRDKGTPKMQEIWNAIKTGANAYLRQQLRTIFPVLIVLTVALFLSVYVVKPTEEAERLYGDNAQIVKHHRPQVEDEAFNRVKGLCRRFLKVLKLFLCLIRIGVKITFTNFSLKNKVAQG